MTSWLPLPAMSLVLCFFGIQTAIMLPSTLAAVQLSKIWNPSWGPPRLSTGWKDRSLASCIVKCLNRYGSACESVMYNHETRLCTPGQRMINRGEVPSAEEGELYAPYFCNTSSGFALYSYNNSRACLQVNRANWANYTKAKAACAAVDSFQYSVKNMDTFNLLIKVIKENLTSDTWVGLDDLATEGKFIYTEDGTPLDPVLQNQTFAPGEPNGFSSKENCVSMMQKYYKFNDADCSFGNSYICERSIF